MKIIYIFYVLLFLFCVLFTIERFCRWQEKTFLEILRKEWFEDVTRFPVKDFQCKVNCEKYNQLVSDGYDVMKGKRLIIAGLCINIEKKADILRKRIEHLGSFFDDYKCVIFENDSSDKTRAILKNFANENPNIILLDCPESTECKLKTKSAVKDGVVSANRMKKMANYRNRLITHIQENYSDYDCVCFLDLDIKGPISIDGVAHTFGNYGAWDSVSAFGITGVSFLLGHQIYYDVLAFNDGDLVFDEQNVWLNAAFVVKRLNKCKIGDDLIPVLSGFCGMAFYTMDVINSGVDYTPKDGVFKCEHLIFHDNMRNKNFSNIFLNPNMVLLAGAQGDSSVFLNH